MNERFKKNFWLWLKINTNFYLCRSHHKDDIENAIDYSIKQERLLNGYRKN